MSKFELHLDSLKMPNFRGNNSRKNFRLLFDVTLHTADNKIANTLVMLPPTRDWQWRSKNSDNYISVMDPTADPVELDLSVMDKNQDGFSKTDREILIGIGTILRVKVTVIDVGDSNFGQALLFVAKQVLPNLIAGGVSVATGAVGSKIIGTMISDINKNDDLSSVLLDAYEKQFKKKSGDKILFKGGERIDQTQKQFSIKGTGKGKDKSHKGQYEIGLKLL